MNNNLVNRRVVPQRAIIVYGDKGEYGAEYYLESREIRPKNGGFEFMAPQPLSKSTMMQIAGSFMQRNNVEMDFGGIIAPHLLLGINRPGKMAVIWYRPAQSRLLNFSSTVGVKGTPNVEIPATLYMVLNYTLYVFALMADDRPDGATKLYNAPFFNIYTDANVCLGTAPVGKVRSSTFEGEAARYERGFYMAEQNGGSGKPCKTDLGKLWTQQIKKGGPFPAKTELIQHSRYKTLNDLISKLIGTNGQQTKPLLEDDFEDEDEEEIEIGA